MWKEYRTAHKYLGEKNPNSFSCFNIYRFVEDWAQNTRKHHFYLISHRWKQFAKKSSFWIPVIMADIGSLSIDSKTTKVRHAEKDRKYSTCAFADRVASKVIETYKTVLTTNQSQIEAPKGQRVLAGFCQYDRAHDSLVCVSFGVGTKYRKYRDVSGAIAPKSVCTLQWVYFAVKMILTRKSLNN